MYWKDKLYFSKIFKSSKVRLVSFLSFSTLKLRKKKISRSKALLVGFFVLLLGTIIVYAIRIPVEEVVISIEPVTRETPCEQEREGEKLFFAPEGGKADSKDLEVASCCQVVDEVYEEKEERCEEILPVFSEVAPLYWPVQGEVLVKHGEMFRVERELRVNVGIDIAAEFGTLVKAGWPGVVKETGESLLLGRYIILSHGERYISHYANLDEIKVEEGRTVLAGEVIATTGNSATIDAGPGEHLHFALYLLEGDGDMRRKVALDPLEYLLERL